MWAPQGEERRDRRKVRRLHTVQPGTPLTGALGLLLEAGVSVLPVVDNVRALCTRTFDVLPLQCAHVELCRLVPTGRSQEP